MGCSDWWPAWARPKRRRPEARRTRLGESSTRVAAPRVPSAEDRLDGWYVWLDESGDCADVDTPPLRITEVSFDDDVGAIRAIEP